MNSIYTVKRTDNIGYDEFNAMVVIAPSPQEARKMLPPYCTYDSITSIEEHWTTNYDSLDVTYVGKSEHLHTQILLASFVAG